MAVTIGSSIARIVAMQSLQPLAVVALLALPVAIGLIEWLQAKSYGPKQAKFEADLRPSVLRRDTPRP